MKIYVETSIPSFYFDTRSSTEMKAKRKWTRDWWAMTVPDTTRVIGEPVVLELEAAPSPKREQALRLIKDLPILDFTLEIDEIAQAYIRHMLMPREALGDAAHLALASFHKCDLLVTWNCRHLANANKFPHIRRINGLLGLFSPALVTPLELLGRNENEKTT